MRVPISERILWRVLDFDPEENAGLIAPVPADWIVEAAMNGEPVPLARCDEEDAWRHRTRMVEVGGRLDGDEGENQAVPTSGVKQGKPASLPIIDDDDLPF